MDRTKRAGTPRGVTSRTTPAGAATNLSVAPKTKAEAQAQIKAVIAEKRSILEALAKY